MPVINFRVDDETQELIKAEAAKVPYRTVSDWLRELVDAATKRTKRQRRPK